MGKRGGGRGLGKSMEDVGKLGVSECGKVWLGTGKAWNGEEGWIQNFRVLSEGLLEVLQVCELEI